MSTGWKWVSSDGEEFKSQLRAKEYLRDHPDMKMYFSELSMTGEKRTDVTLSLKNAIRTD